MGIVAGLHGEDESNEALANILRERMAADLLIPVVAAIAELPGAYEEMLTVTGRHRAEPPGDFSGDAGAGAGAAGQA